MAQIVRIYLARKNTRFGADGFHVRPHSVCGLPARFCDKDAASHNPLLLAVLRQIQHQRLRQQDHPLFSLTVDHYFPCASDSAVIYESSLIRMPVLAIVCNIAQRRSSPRSRAALTNF